MGQFAPLFSYLTFAQPGRLSTDWSPSVAVTRLALALTVIGAGVATVAVRGGERHGQALFVVAMLGALIAVILLALYSTT